MNPYTMARSTDADGVIWFTFTPKGRVETLTLSPDEYQSGAAMNAYVLAWIASL